MTFFKKFLYHSSGALFKLLLVIVPVVFALAVVFGSPSSIQQALKESRVYDQIVGAVIDNSKQTATETQDKDLLAQPEVKAAAEKAFTPEVLQNSTETVLDGIFAWLQGKTSESEFRVDLSGPKQTLTQGITDYAKKRADSLPVCTLEQLRTLNPNTDLLSLPCRPPGTNTQQIADEFGRRFQTDSEFLKDPVITSDNFAKSSDGKTLGQSLSSAPTAYQAIQTGKWLLLAVATLLALVLVFARHDRRAGVRHVAWGLLGTAVFLLVAQIIYWFLFDRANSTKPGDPVTQVMLLDGTKALIREFNEVVLWFTAAYGALGAILLILLRTWLKPQPAPAADEPPSSQTASASAPQEAEKTP